MATERLIQSAFVLQRDEFTKAQRLVLRNLPTKIRVFGWLQCGLLAALALLGLAYRPDGELRPISLIITFLVWLVFLTSGMARRALATLQFARMEGAEIWYEFDERGFRCGMPNAESRLDWPAVATFLETDALFVVVQSGILFYTIPKRALEAADVGSLRLLLAEKLRARV